jgi:Ni,Fe-hydrogenase III large subunit
MRTCLCELNRLHSHLIWLGTSALELGAISLFWYAFREREQILDLFEMVTGARMHTRYFQIGGLAEDIPSGFFPEARKFVEWMPHAIDDYEAMLTRNKIWLERTEGIGLLSADDALALGQSGPVLRASGVHSRTSPTPSATSTSRSSRRATSTRATASTWRRCASRRRSSASASTGSRAWSASRGSSTTARSCCRRARSCTPRWSR